MKADLSPQEKIIAAYANVCLNVSQQDIAAMFLVNGGRVNEAVKLITGAVGLSDGGYKSQGWTTEGTKRS